MFSGRRRKWLNWYLAVDEVATSTILLTVSLPTATVSMAMRWATGIATSGLRSNSSVEQHSGRISELQVLHLLLLIDALH